MLLFDEFFNFRISTDSTDALADISFRIVDQSRYEEILQLLYTNFHSDEPMSKAVQMIDREGTRNKVLDEFALQGLVQVSLFNYRVSKQASDDISNS